jgi:hypothetical protein
MSLEPRPAPLRGGERITPGDRIERVPLRAPRSLFSDSSVTLLRLALLGFHSRR